MTAKVATENSWAHCVPWHRSGRVLLLSLLFPDEPHNCLLFTHLQHTLQSSGFMALLRALLRKVCVGVCVCVCVCLSVHSSLSLSLFLSLSHSLSLSTAPTHTSVCLCVCVCMCVVCVLSSYVQSSEKTCSLAPSLTAQVGNLKPADKTVRE